jgi:N-formylglutamate amidohydrolase.
MFEEEINMLEGRIKIKDYLLKNGNTPIMITAVHTVYQEHKDKFAEGYTGAICQYVANKIDAFYAIKCIDNGIDSNSIETDEFKEFVVSQINKHNIKLIIDLHGAKREREFDVEIGTLSGLSSDITVIKTLETCFNNNGIDNIAYNDPFKGGGITQAIFGNTDTDIIQIEINGNFRDKHDLEKCEQICDSLIEFTKIFANFN